MRWSMRAKRMRWEWTLMPYSNHHLLNRGSCVSCLWMKQWLDFILWNPQIHSRSHPILHMHAHTRALVWLINVPDNVVVNKEFNYQHSLSAKWLWLYFVRSTKCHANWRSSAISSWRGSSTKSKCFSVFLPLHEGIFLHSVHSVHFVLQKVIIRYFSSAAQTRSTNWISS